MNTIQVIFSSLNQEEVKGESERIEIENEKEKIFKADVSSFQI